MRIEHRAMGVYILPSLPSPSALPYQVAVAGCHSGSTTLCAAPEASTEPKRHAAHTSDDARSAARMEKPQQAAEELEEAPAMARAHVREEQRNGGGGTARQRTPTDTPAVLCRNGRPRSVARVVVVLTPLSGMAFKASRSPSPRRAECSELPPCTNGGEAGKGQWECTSRVLGWW